MPEVQMIGGWAVLLLGLIAALTGVKKMALELRTFDRIALGFALCAAVFSKRLHSTQLVSSRKRENSLTCFQERADGRER